MKKRAVSCLLVIMTVFSLISLAYAEKSIVSGDLPNYLTVYGDKASLTGKDYQPRNKYNDEFYRYKYDFDAEPYADVISEYAALLEKYDIWLADTWKRNLLWRRTTNGPLSIRI